MQAYPHREFTAADGQSDLGSLGLCPSASLLAKVSQPQQEMDVSVDVLEPSPLDSKPHPEPIDVEKIVSQDGDNKLADESEPMHESDPDFDGAEYIEDSDSDNSDRHSENDYSDPGSDDEMVQNPWDIARGVHDRGNARRGLNLDQMRHELLRGNLPPLYGVRRTVGEGHRLGGREEADDADMCEWVWSIIRCGCGHYRFVYRLLC